MVLLVMRACAICVQYIAGMYGGGGGGGGRGDEWGGGRDYSSERKIHHFKQHNIMSFKNLSHGILGIG